MDFPRFILGLALLALALVILLGWPVPLFLGIRTLRRGGPGARRRGAVLLTLGFAWTGAAEGLLNAFLSARDSAACASCSCTLGTLGPALAQYAGEHGGQPAPRLGSLLGGSLTANFLACPLGSRYAYRPLSHPRPNDIVAWDSKPHPDRRHLILLVTARRRNVLYANGRCRSLSEEEFRAAQGKWDRRVIGR